MKTFGVVALALATLTVGCSSKPDCGSSDAKDGVPEIAKANQLYLQSIYANGFQKRSAELLPSSFQGDLARLKQLSDETSKLSMQLNQTIGKCMEIRGPNTNTNANNAICSTGLTFERTPAPANMQDYVDYYNKNYVPLKQATDKAYAEFNELKKKLEAQEAENLNKTSKDWEESVAKSKYKLENIIMTNKTESTGAVTCKAQMMVDVPNWGSTTQNIGYKLEKNTDGKVFATIF